MDRLVSAATALCLVLTTHGASAQDLASQIVGTWRWDGHVYKEVATGRTTNVFGEKPSGLMAFTKGGNLVYAVFGEGRMVPAANPAADGVGNRLTLTSAPFKNPQSGQDTVFIVTYERVE